jgi:Flp pilus assembly protein TadG
MVRARVRRRGAADRGSGVVEFALLTVLLVVLLFAVLQVAIWFYARSIVASAAADGAHYAATLQSTSSTGVAGEQRARQLIVDGLNARIARDIVCTGTTGVDAASGLQVAVVRCQGRPHMLLLPFDLPLGIDVHSSVLVESSP